jgi:hypothetical protein
MNKHWPLGALSLAASLLFGTTSFAAQSLLCEVRYASETRMLRQSVSADPYDAQTVDFEGRFRFKAVVLGTADHIEHITLTVYELGVGDAPVIVHQVRHQSPFHAGTELPALTGWNHVYASYLGRELRYGCALQPVALTAGKEAAQ